ELQQAAKKNETNGRRYVRPITRQQNRRNNDDQRIKEVEESINSAGEVDNGGDKAEIGKNLGKRLGLVFVPQVGQQGEEYRDREPHHHHGDEGPDRNIVGREVDDQQLDCQQKRDDEDTDFYKPCQPRPLVKFRVPHQTFAPDSESVSPVYNDLLLRYAGS